jgi:hypothetical protein
MIDDMILLWTKIKSIFRFFKFVFGYLSWPFNIIKNLICKLFKRKTLSENSNIETTPKLFEEKKVTLGQRIKNILTPRAKLTYWLADEEVIVYVSKFTQKDKFKLLYTEIETGRQVMVNSANPINYRLEELKAGDQVEKTEIQQNQHY